MKQNKNTSVSSDKKKKNLGIVFLLDRNLLQNTRVVFIYYYSYFYRTTF